MLEIIAIVVLVRIIGGMAEDKDLNGLWFKILRLHCGSLGNSSAQ
jgi:hypothetical protein